MDEDYAERVALHRWAVIAESSAARLGPAERGLAVRAIAEREHTGPDGSARRYSRGTVDRWVRTVRAQLRRRGLTRAALAAEPKAFGRYEAARPNERWITDVLVGPWVPHPRREGSVRGRLFLIVDDHSRLLVHGRFMPVENARSGQEVLRQAIARRGLCEILYADNGAPYANAWLARTCAVLGIRLVHSKPYSPQGRGKQERLNRYVREAFL